MNAMFDNRWVLPVDDDGVLVFPPELIEKMNWTEETVLKWDVRDDGSITLSAATEFELEETSQQCTLSPQSVIENNADCC